MFSSNYKRLNGPCIVQAQWNEDYYGAPPTLVPDAFVVPASNTRPMKVHFYCKVHFTINSNAYSELLVFVSWLKPHPQRYTIGKPAELWYYMNM